MFSTYNKHSFFDGTDGGQTRTLYLPTTYQLLTNSYRSRR